MADVRRTTTNSEITVAQARAMLERRGIDAPVPTAFVAPLQEDGWQSATITNAHGVNVLALLEILERADMAQRRPSPPPPDASGTTFGDAVRAEQERARHEAGAGSRARRDRTIDAIATALQWLSEHNKPTTARAVVQHWWRAHGRTGDLPPVPSLRTVERHLKAANSRKSVRGTRAVGSNGGGISPR